MLASLPAVASHRRSRKEDGNGVRSLLTLTHVPSFRIPAIHGAVILASLIVTDLAAGDA